MARIYNGRYTAAMEKGVVVFLVGMRVNRFLAMRKWWPIFVSMKNMIVDLEMHPGKGMVASQTRISWREIMVVTYWDSYEQLESYGRSKKEMHLGYWKKYNKNIGASGVVGIWHECYAVSPGDYECVYVNMPVTGLARSKDIRFLEAKDRLETSRLRIGRGENRPAVPSSMSKVDPDSSQ